MADEVFRTKVATAGACMPAVPEDSVWNVVVGAGDMSEMPNVVGIAQSRFHGRQLPAAVASAQVVSVMCSHWPWARLPGCSSSSDGGGYSQTG